MATPQPPTTIPIAIALLHLISHSSLFRHFCFVRSPRVGAGRRTIYKQDLDAFPFPNIEAIGKDDREQAFELADKIDQRTSFDWDAVDRFVCRLFCIPAADAEVIGDTIEQAAPYQAKRNRAGSPPNDENLSKFTAKLETALQPFFKVVKQKVCARIVPKLAGTWNPPWRFITVTLDGDTFEPSAAFIAKLMRVAAQTSASRVVMPVPKGGLVLGLLNQRRFWTQSRAQLCALHIAREHLDKTFPLQSADES
jgi:hypothetical protein